MNIDSAAFRSTLGSLALCRESATALPAEIRIAIEFFRRPEVQELVTDLQRSIFNFILETSEPLYALDRQTPRGDYVREGVRELFTRAQGRGEVPLVVDRFGAVMIMAEGCELCVGDISLSQDSVMLRQPFVNKSLSTTAAKSVFQISQIDTFVGLQEVVQGHPSGFVLDDKRSLAAEIVMSMDYLIVYAQIAESIVTKEQDSGEELLRMKVGANLQDSFAAASYLRILERRLSDLTTKISVSFPWTTLSLPGAPKSEP